MPERIPQSSTIRVPLQAYLSSDHVTPATGKTLAVTISKNGAAYGNPSGGATNATEIANGSYYVDLSTTDAGTLGPLFIRATASGVDDVVAIYNVVSATNGGLSNLDATVSSRSTYAGGAVASVTAAVTVGTNNDKSGYSLSQAFPANFATLGISSGGHINTVDTLTGNTPQTGDAYAYLAGANAIETGVDFKKAIQRIGAVVAGKISGAGTGTEVFVGLDGVTTRVTVTVDTNGNRTSVAYA